MTLSMVKMAKWRNGLADEKLQARRVNGDTTLKTLLDAAVLAAEATPACDC
jgi:hypothetical protein